MITGISVNYGKKKEKKLFKVKWGMTSFQSAASSISLSVLDKVVSIFPN